jgi:thioesterase domain-containing protein
MGGGVAFEMSRQLVEQGEEVALLALLDSVAPARRRRLNGREDPTRLLRSFALDLGLAPAHLERLPAGQLSLESDEQMTVLLEGARAAGLISEEVELPHLRRLWKVFQGNALAIRKYTPRPARVRMLLLRAGGRTPSRPGDPTEGWGRLTTAGIEVSLVPGDHYSIMREPNVRALAEELRPRLDAAAEGEVG